LKYIYLSYFFMFLLSLDVITYMVVDDIAVRRRGTSTGDNLAKIGYLSLCSTEIIVYY